MLLDILKAVAYAVSDAAADKISETKNSYNQYYERYSERAQRWDNQKLINEYQNASDFTRKAALYKLMQERGLVK